MDNARLALLLEAEKRGILPAEQKVLLAEGRKRGLIPSVDFSARTMAGNVPKSGGKYLRDMAEPFIHPVQTAKAFGNLAAGMAQQVVPGEQEKEAYADAAKQHILDRYGSIDNFKTTLMQDPVGVLADASMVLTLGGTAAAQVPGKVGKIGKAVQRAGVAAEPLNIAQNTAEIAGKVMPKRWIRKGFDYSVKWPTTSDIGDPGKRARMTETALAEGIPPNERGVGKMHLLIGDLKQKVGNLIDNAGDAPISPYELYKRLDDAEKKMTGFRLDAAENAEVFSNLRATLDDIVQKQQGAPLTARVLQDFKLALDEKINWSKTNQSGKLAENVGMKAVRRGAKESIAEKLPEVDEINKRLMALQELEPNLERAAGRRENLNPMSLTGAVAIAGGADVAGTPGAVIGGGLSALQRKGAEIAVYLEKLRSQKVPENYIQNRVLPALLREASVELGRLNQSVNEPEKRKVNKNSDKARN